MKTVFKYSLVLLMCVCASNALAQDAGITALTATQAGSAPTTYSLSLKVLLLMTALSLLPALFMTATSFTRIIIVLAILRQALGLHNVPTNQIVIGLALFMTLFVMQPTFTQAYTTAIDPYLNEKISESEALEKMVVPFKSFMIKQTRKEDLGLFLKLSKQKMPEDIEQVSLFTLMPAFITSELKTAFQMGFLIYLPFLIIDLVVASVLMSMGMMMLSPLVISLPFKILLFVMIDGWVMILGTLSNSFRL